MEEENKINEEELDIQNLAESSIEDENKTMFDLNEFKLPEIGFGSSDEHLEESKDETEEEESITVKSEEETDEELPDMSPMSEMLVEDNEQPEDTFAVDDAQIDFELTEQSYQIQEEAYDLGETQAKKTEVAIIDTVAVNRLTDIKKEFEAIGLQPPVSGPKPISSTAREGKGVMAASPMDFDADKFPPMGAGTPPSSSAFFKSKGSSDIKIGSNPFGYA